MSTLEACLASITPAIKRGVIGYNDCTDGSDEYIQSFCRQNPGFIPLPYPQEVYKPNDPRYFNTPLQDLSGHTLADYYNAVLQQIPENSWLVKIDADQIYIADKLQTMFHVPKHENDCVVLSRLNLHYDGKKLYFFKHQPILYTADHWLIHKHDLLFVMSITHNAKKVQPLKSLTFLVTK